MFQAAGFDCARVPNSGGLRLKGDLYGNVPVHVEVKRAERWDIPEWWRQAEADAPQGVTPVLCFRRNAGQWFAMLPLTDLVGLLESAAHDG